MTAENMHFWVAILTLLLRRATVGNSERKFSIDYDSNQFLKDGEPFRYISGSIHYFRVPYQYWDHHLRVIKSMGLNTIQFYIPWNWHEPQPGVYDWGLDRNLTHFVKLAQELDLLVIVRLGPYTCGEWENGGYPWWLLKIPGIQLRRSEPNHVREVAKWFSVLLPKLRPLNYENGGPVIMYQIENEYGSHGICDKNYMHFLRDTARKFLGNETILFTVDGPSANLLKCGTIHGAYATVDFGPSSKTGIANAFKAQRLFSPKGPLVNTEFYPGWLDVWGQPWSVSTIPPILDSMKSMYDLGASFNFYMIYGGTNYGYWAGAGGWVPYTSVTTSYDYNAPITEAGDPTEKLLAIRSMIANLTQVKPIDPVPGPSQKIAYGNVSLVNLGPLAYVLKHEPNLAPATLQVNSTNPLSFEDANFPYGFMLYESQINQKVSNITLSAIGDRAYVYTDWSIKGVLIRDINRTLILPNNTLVGKLTILVENMGRECSGSIDRKGILGNVTLDGNPHKGWTMKPIVLESLFQMAHSVQVFESSAKSPLSLQVSAQWSPSIFAGWFSAEKIADTYFDPTGWGKGVLFINGHNVGRYWPSKGPQVTLYIPKVFLQEVNSIVLFELEKAGNCTNEGSRCVVRFTDTPYLDKPIHSPTKLKPLYNSVHYKVPL